MNPLLPDALQTSQVVPSSAQGIHASSVPAISPQSAMGDAKQSIHVDLSATAQSMGKNQPAKNQDIDDSDLPDAVKDLLKYIREIRAMLEEKMRELSAAMSDHSLSDEERRIRIDNLQTEVSMLNSALMSANGQLLKLMKSMDLSSGQQLNAGALAMKTGR